MRSILTTNSEKELKIYLRNSKAKATIQKFQLIFCWEDKKPNKLRIEPISKQTISWLILGRRIWNSSNFLIWWLSLKYLKTIWSTILCLEFSVSVVGGSTPKWSLQRLENLWGCTERQPSWNINMSLIPTCIKTCWRTKWRWQLLLKRLGVSEAR